MTRSLRLQALDVQPAAARAEVASAIAMSRRGERVPLERFNALTGPERGRVDMERPNYNAKVKADAKRRMAIMDGWTVDQRDCANELGFAIVHAFIQAGIKKPNLIKHLVAVARFQQVDGRPAAYGNHRIGSQR